MRGAITDLNFVYAVISIVSTDCKFQRMHSSASLRTAVLSLTEDFIEACERQTRWQNNPGKHDQISNEGFSNVRAVCFYTMCSSMRVRLSGIEKQAR